MECCYNFEINGIKGEFLDVDTFWYEDSSLLSFSFDGIDCQVVLKKLFYFDEVFIRNFLVINKVVPYICFDGLKTQQLNLQYLSRYVVKSNLKAAISGHYLYVVPNNFNIVIHDKTPHIKRGTELEETECPVFALKRGHRRYKVLRKYNVNKVLRGE